MVSNYDISVEEKMRWISWYDFNFHVLALKKRNDAMERDD